MNIFKEILKRNMELAESFTLLIFSLINIAHMKITVG